MSSTDESYEGSCLCGQVKIRVQGKPLRAGYCHCQTCRTWHAAPINAVAVFRDKSVQVMEGEEALANYDTDTSNRHWCGNCGSGIMNRLRREADDTKPRKPGFTVVYAALLTESGFVHEPAYHIHCDEAMLDLQDGVPKFVDWPDSERLPEPERTGTRGA